jgi:hypothetical protein
MNATKMIRNTSCKSKIFQFNLIRNTELKVGAFPRRIILILVYIHMPFSEEYFIIIYQNYF